MKMLTFACAIAVLASECAGCDLGAGWSDLPYSEITPVGGDRFDDPSGMTWAAEVQGASDEWADALEPLCGFRPFVVLPDGGHPVIYLPLDAWDHGHDELGYEHHYSVGDMTWGETIEIRQLYAEYGYRPILLHELGHAMGLHHMEPHVGVMSPMPAYDHLQKVDIDAAALALGCTP